MCGILCVFGPDAEKACTQPIARAELIRRSALLRHRGPDGTGVMVSDDAKCFMAHERLNIVDTSELGTQPQKIDLEDETIMWMW